MGARLLAGALIAACWACGPQPDFVTGNGVAFHLNGSAFIGQREAEALEESFVDALRARPAYAGARTAQCLALTVVLVEPRGPFPCASDPDQSCAGEQYGPRLKVAASGCAYDSAYLHELLHWLQECVEERVDYQHRDDAWRVVGDQIRQASTACLSSTGPARGSDSPAGG